MNVPSYQFLIFSAVAAVVVWLAGAVRLRQAALLLANAWFVSTFSADWRAFVPFAGFLALGYLGMRAMERPETRRLFLPVLLAVLVVFFWLKRYTFLPSALFLPSGYLLVGMSYVFFRVLHLVIDARDGRLPHRVGIVPYLSYTMDFRCLVAGPIQRYEDFDRMQGAERLPVTAFAAGRAVERIVIGFFKVAIVSLVLHDIQAQALAALSDGAPLWSRVGNGIVIAVAYPLFLYANFSGYTDVVIGVARFFGMRLPENFDRPFSSKSFIDFWNRWHITLSTWLKTYVYTPLLVTLMRRYPSPAAEPYFGVFAFFVTFFLVGAWHGQTSIFLVFGLLQGGGVSVNKLYQIVMARRLGRKQYRALTARPLYGAFARGLTFTWFTFTLYCFWSQWGQIAQIAHGMGALAMALAWVIILLGATLVLALLEWLRERALSVTVADEPVVLSRYTRTVFATVLVVITVSAMALLQAPAPDIVYRSF